MLATLAVTAIALVWCAVELVRASARRKHHCAECGELLTRWDKVSRGAAYQCARCKRFRSWLGVVTKPQAECSCAQQDANQPRQPQGAKT